MKNKLTSEYRSIKVSLIHEFRKFIRLYCFFPLTDQNLVELAYSSYILYNQHDKQLQLVCDSLSFNVQCPCYT